MRKLVLVTLVAVFAAGNAFAQVKGRTKPGSFGIPAATAKLSVTAQFTEPSGNNALDPNETGTLTLTIKNDGDAEAKDVVVRLSAATAVPGITFPSTKSVGSISSKGSLPVRMEIAASENVKSQDLTLSLEALDANGVRSEATAVRIPVRSLAPAMLSSTVEFLEPSGNKFLDAGETATVMVTVYNSGSTTAKGVIAKLKVTDALAGVRYPQTSQIGELKPKASGIGTFNFVADDNVRSQTATVVIEVSDVSGATAEPRSVTISTKERALAKDETPPQIEVWEPVVTATRGIKIISSDTKFSTQNSSVTVRGIARDSSGVAVVLINGQEARLSVGKDGFEFVGDALLVLGENDVEIKAIDRFKNENKLSVRVTRQPEARVEKKVLAMNLFKGQRWAAVIGISQYRETEIPPLRYADRDAEQFYNILIKPIEEGGMGVPKANVRFLLNEKATSSNVKEAMTDFLKSAIEEDIVYIYFAGHGAPDPDRPKILYLLTYDSDLNKLASTSVKMQEIQDALRDYVAAKTVLVFADACHSRGVSGTIATRALATPDLVNEYLSELARARASTLTFSASDVNQLSQEDKRWGDGHGVFTYYLLEGLKGKADLNNDKIVRLGELTQYVNDNVRRDTKSQQSPISSGSFDINMPLTVVP